MSRAGDPYWRPGDVVRVTYNNLSFTCFELSAEEASALNDESEPRPWRLVNVKRLNKALQWEDSAND